MTKSLSARAPKSVVARSRPTRTLFGHELAKPWLRHRALTQVDLVDDALSHVDPRHRPAALSQHGTNHRADVAEAHNCDARPHAAHQEIDLSVATSEHAFRHRGSQPFTCCGRSAKRSGGLTAPANPLGSLIQHPCNRPEIHKLWVRATDATVFNRDGLKKANRSCRASAASFEAGEVFHMVSGNRSAFGGFGHPGGDLAGPREVLRGQDPAQARDQRFLVSGRALPGAHLQSFELSREKNG